jgi:cytochrome c oxidase subunit 3
MSRREIKNRHFFHIVDKSPWPLMCSLAAGFLTSSAVLWFHTGLGNFLLFSLSSILIAAILWFRDVIREGTFEGHHTKEVQTSLKYGMFLFIVSEFMLFFSFFWTFFHSSLAPAIQIGGIWPPLEIEILNTWAVPALNTAILLTSGASITWAHYALVKNDREQVRLGFIVTLFLAVLFTSFQLMEYFESTYFLSDGIYGSIFFTITGFHGIHVFIGTCFLLVCFFRYLNFHFTPKHHVGFQAAAWYWHFVDVIWILLFCTVYIWGNFHNINENVLYIFNTIE